MHLTLADEQATRCLGAQLAVACPPELVIYLHGDLGAGKTTLVRALLQALGHQGAVRSPTYTLIEPYEMQGRRAFHLDLYRLSDPGELEYLGLRDLLDAEALLLVEWPSRGLGLLPPADLDLTLSYVGEGREVELTAHGSRGEAVLKTLAEVVDAG